MFAFIVSAERPWMDDPEERIYKTADTWHDLLVADAKALGACVWNIAGKWNGIPERSILGLCATESDAHRIACFLGKRYHQDAVVVCGKLVDPKTGEVLNRFSSCEPPTPPKPGTPEHRKWSAIHMASPGPDRWKERSRTFPGMAEAMADQWSSLLPLEVSPNA